METIFRGDDKSFSKIYHAYYSELLAYALNLGFDDERSKDAIQDIFSIFIFQEKIKPHSKYRILSAQKSKTDFLTLETWN